MEPLEPPPTSATPTRQTPPSPSASRSGDWRHQPENIPSQSRSPSLATPSSDTGQDTLDLSYSPSPDLQSLEKKGRRLEGQGGEGKKTQGKEDLKGEQQRPRLNSILIQPRKQDKPTKARTETRTRQRSYRDAVVGERKDDRRSATTSTTHDSRNHDNREAHRRGEDWKEVKAKYRWRRDRPPKKLARPRSIEGGNENPRKSEYFRERFKRHTFGRCFKCLARDHKVADCRDLPKCLLCFHSGHKAKYCRATTRATSHQKTPSFPHGVSIRKLGAEQNQTKSAQRKSEKEAMEDPIPGAPHLRPERVEARIRRTNAMEAEERDMTVRALLAVAADANAVLSCQAVEEALRQQFGLEQEHLEVTLFGKATFLIRFGSPQKRSQVLATAWPIVVS